jgi:hypothetical protein
VLLALASFIPTPASRDFFAQNSAVGFGDAEVMDIEFKGLSQLAPGVVIPAINTDAVGIVLRTLNFTFADFINRRQQGVNINAACALFSLAVFISATSLNSDRAS